MSDELKHNYLKIGLSAFYGIAEGIQLLPREVLNNIFILIAIIISMQFGVDLLKVRKNKKTITQNELVEEFTFARNEK